MKTFASITLGSVLLLLAAGLTVTSAQTRKSRATKEFMRDKLELSQKILEGLTGEDYDLIVANAQKLSAMSQEAAWQAFENPDYAQQSLLFRKQVDALSKAGRDKNLDAATLAYLRMTMSCVDYHKLVRGKLVASNR